MPRDFFSVRLQSEFCHVKAFASECIGAVRILVIFCKERSDRDGIMRDHSCCIQLLGKILDILSLRDGAVPFVDALRDLFVQHHQLFLLLYGSARAKVKFHLAHRIPSAIRRHGVLLDCFSC